MTDELKKLWNTVFGDAPYVIDKFFDMFYTKELTAVEYIDGKPVASAYVLPAGYLINGSIREKCAHIYAVAVSPEFRGQGLGISVTSNAVSLAKDAGFSAVVLHPASPSLFNFYKNHCGFNECFSAHTYKKSSLNYSPTHSPVDSGTYITIRESILANTPHIELTSDIFDFFQFCGGKLYVFDGGCAAVEVIGNTTYVRELLGNISDFTLPPYVNSNTCIINTIGNDTPSGMIWNSSDFQHGWLGLSLE